MSTADQHSADAPESTTSSTFESEAQEQQVGLVAEFVDFLKHNKKWWLGPVIAVVLLVGVLLVAAGGAAAPFIYTLF